MSISRGIEEVLKWNEKVKEVAEKQYSGDDSMGMVDGWTGDIDTHLRILLNRIKQMENDLAKAKDALRGY